MAEIRRKEALARAIVQQLNVLLIRFLKEHLGIEITPEELAAGGGGSGLVLIKRIIKAALAKGAKPGEIKEIKRLFGEACAPEAPPDEAPHERAKRKKPSKKRIAGRLALKFGGRYLDVFATVALALAAKWKHHAEQEELLEKLKKLRRAIRYEFLLVNWAEAYVYLNVDPKQLDAKTHKALVPPAPGKPPRCTVNTLTQYMYRDPKSGDIKRNAIQRHEMSYKDKRKLYETPKVTLPDQGCNAALRVEHWLVCDPEPPLSRQLFTTVLPVRTTKKCPKFGLIRDGGG